MHAFDAREAFTPKEYIHIIPAYGFPMVYDLLVFKEVTRNEIFDSSSVCFESIS